MLKSNLFDYNDAFILVSGDIISIRRRNLPTEVACNNCPLNVLQKLIEQQ